MIVSERTTEMKREEMRIEEDLVIGRETAETSKEIEMAMLIKITEEM